MKMPSALLVASVFMFLVTSCVTTEVKESGPYEKNVTVHTKKGHEDCFELAMGQSMQYAFESSGPLDFNVHCHEDGEVMMPVKLKAVSKNSGTFVADRDEYWCLMWENRSRETVKLSYEFTIGEKQPE